VLASTSMPPSSGRRLVALERALYTVSSLSPLNLVVLVRLDGAAVDELLPAALAALQHRHPLLRARIAGGPARPRFEVSPPPVGASDLSAIPVRIVQADEKEAADAVVEAEMNAPFDTATGPLARLTFLRGAGNSGELILTLHHAIADGVSTAGLVHELLDWCAARLTGGTVPTSLPEPVPSPLTDLLPGGMRGAQGALRLLRFAGRDARDELSWRRGSRGRRLPIPASGRAAASLASLAADQTSALVDRSRRQRLTMTGVLTAGLLWQANSLLYSSRPVTMRAIVWVDLRPYLDPPVSEMTLACYASMLRFVVRVDQERGFAALIADVQAAIERASRRGDRFPAAVLSAPMTRLAVRWPVGRLGTVALSYAAAAVQPSYGPVSVREVRAFVSNNRFGAEVAASCGVYRGGLWCDLLYLASDYGQETAAALGDGLLSTLREYAGQT
jgi:Condensation domain